MDDSISRKAAIDALDEIEVEVADGLGFQYEKWRQCFAEMPSAQPYTDADIQKMQDLEQAQFEKMYQLGYEEGKKDAQPEIIRCKDCERFDKRRGCNLVEGLNIAKTDSYCSYAERREE